MATQKYINTDESGMGEYADVPGKRSRVIGGTQSKAGAGRGATKMTPAEQAMVQEAQDAKDSKAAGAAYDKASPATYKKGGSVAMDKAQDKAMIVKAFKQHDAQEHKSGKGTVLKLAAGGSASKRADGCAQRGKTRA